MPAPPDGSKARVQSLGHSVNFLLDGYCNLTQECSALGLIWLKKLCKHVNILGMNELVLFLLETRKLILKGIIIWETEIINAFHRLVGRL